MILAIYGSIVAAMIILAVVEAFQDAAEARGERMRRWPTNIGLALINAVVGMIVPASSVYAAFIAEHYGIGLMQMIPLPYALVVVVSLIILTLCTYAIHRMFHEVPMLWRLHQIHHSDTSIDSTTAVRHHPVEVVLTGCIFAVIVVIFGVDPMTAMVLALIDQAFAVWTHTAKRLPYALHLKVCRVFVTPLIHRSHHSNDVRETNTNYGNTFTVWDQVFGTFLAEPIRPDSEFETGLEQYDTRQAASLRFQLGLPFRKG